MAEYPYEDSSLVERIPLRIAILRSGRVEEVVRFLTDLEAAYTATYLFELDLLRWARIHRSRRFLMHELDLFEPHIGALGIERQSSAVNPEARLQLRGIEIHSPGWAEIIGALNPMQQLREYLKDRHERRKDKEYREAAEEDRMAIERELARRQLEQLDTEIAAKRIQILRSLGYSKAECRQILWERLGYPLSQLGRHQDTGLIAGPIDPDGSARRDRRRPIDVG